MDTLDELVAASSRAGVAEVAWTRPDASVAATAFVPMVHDGRPVIALPFSQRDAALELAACPEVAWVLSDDRLAQRAWQPGAGYGRFRLVVDADGSLFTEHLLATELRKHPPSRAFADSALLRREHWWFLPRLVLVLEPSRVHGVARRDAPERTGVLVVAGGDGRLQADTVRVDGAGDGSWRCTSLSDLRAPQAGAAVLLEHDFSVPDLERWGRRATTGRWDGVRLVPDGPVPDGPVADGPLLPGPPGLRERIRRHRELERACRQALRDVAG